MNKMIAIALLTLAPVAVSAGSYEWTSGWGMGVSEHLVDDGNYNALNISCPDDEGGVSAYATINAKEYSSNDEAGFDVIVDGEVYSNPFFTDCNVCNANFEGFWDDLRTAKRLQLSAQGQIVNLPSKNIGEVLKPLGHPENSCRSAW